MLRRREPRVFAARSSLVDPMFRSGPAPDTPILVPATVSAVETLSADAVAAQARAPTLRRGWATRAAGVTAGALAKGCAQMLLLPIPPPRDPGYPRCGGGAPKSFCLSFCSSFCRPPRPSARCAVVSSPATHRGPCGDTCVRSSSPKTTDYGRVSTFYDRLDDFHYGNVCRRSQRHFLTRLPFQPKRPLIAACGTGIFAVDFVRTVNPPELTLNDLAPSMLTMAATRVRDTGWGGVLHTASGNADALEDVEGYDFIALGYTLNLFPPEKRIAFLSRLKRLLTPDGLFLIADFTRPANPLAMPLFYANWALANLFFWAAAGDRPNVLGDLDAHIRESGLAIVARQSFVWGLYSAFLLRHADAEPWWGAGAP
jgi:ubiquinone/menaquinone biosynthesis C-methylase UbiE